MSCFSFCAPEHLLLKLFCHLGEVLSVFLCSLDNIVIGGGFGNLIDLLGHFSLGSIQLRSKTLIFLLQRRENRKCHLSHLRTRAKEHESLSRVAG